MINTLIFLGFGWLVMSYRKPFHFAAGCAITFAILGLIFGASFVQMLISCAVYFIYCSIVYYLADRFPGQILMPIVILIIGGVANLLLPVIL